MSDTEAVNSGPIPVPVEWSDVAAASEEAQKRDDERDESEVDFVEDTLTIELTDADILQMATENAGRTKERADLEARLDAEKLVVKGTKGQIDAIARTIDECSIAMGNRRMTVTKEWKVVAIFENNSEQWFDPDTGRLVRTKALSAERRQQELFPTAKTVSEALDVLRNPGDGTKVSHGWGGDLKPVGGSGDDVAPSSGPSELPDSTTNLTGDPDATDPFDDDTEIDALEIIDAAATASPSAGSPPPSTPSRRGRR